MEDLDSICLYIARDSPRIAEVFADRLFRSVDRLSLFPLSGRLVPEIGYTHIREVLVGSYRLIYRIRNDAVEIVTVHHGARLLGTVDE